MKSSLPTPEVPDILLAASVEVLKNPGLAHHLAKASIERWFAFELAAELDMRLDQRGWTALVERGGSNFDGTRLGNFDLLLVPTELVMIQERVHARVDPWPTDAIAIELKACHLADGAAARPRALLGDLTEKPKIARACGRRCSFFGVLITTSGLGPGSASRASSATKKRELEMAFTELADGLTIVRRTEPSEVTYRDWSGQVWVEIVVAPPAEQD